MLGLSPMGAIYTASNRKPGFASARPEAPGALTDYIRVVTGATAIEIGAFERLTGGAIQENWALDVSIVGGPHEGIHCWVLRTDASSAVAASLGRAHEYAVLRAAHEAGVEVPQPLWLCQDSAVLGRIFFLMERIQGVAAGHRVTGDASLVPDRAALAEELDANLARLHKVTPPHMALDFMPSGGDNPALEAIVAYRAGAN